MRSSPAIRNGFAFVFAAACASAPPPPPPAPATPGPPPLSSLPLAELEHREFQAPRDPAVKMELARRRWCAGARGLAFENWLWVRQFAASSPQSPEAERLSMLARSEMSSVDETLRCSELVAKP
jgi:hypothetical protein